MMPRPSIASAPSVGAKLSSDIGALFNAYAQAFNVWDSTSIAAMHHAPCLKVHGDGRVEFLESDVAVRDFFRDLMNKYRERGLHSGHFSDLEILPIGTFAALASVTWTCGE